MTILQYTKIILPNILQQIYIYIYLYVYTYAWMMHNHEAMYSNIRTTSYRITTRKYMQQFTVIMCNSYQSLRIYCNLFVLMEFLMESI